MALSISILTVRSTFTISMRCINSKGPICTKSFPNASSATLLEITNTSLKSICNFVPLPAALSRFDILLRSVLPDSREPNKFLCSLIDIVRSSECSDSNFFSIKSNVGSCFFPPKTNAFSSNPCSLQSIIQRTYVPLYGILESRVFISSPLLARSVEFIELISNSPFDITDTW